MSYREFWQRRCRAAAAGAVLKPQGGNCAVLPLCKFKHAVVQLVVFALLGQQFIMAAALHNAAVFQHNNGVGIAYGGKPVGDNKEQNAE